MNIQGLTPEKWMKSILDHVVGLLARSGYRPHPMLVHAHAAIAAAHLTGFEPLYDYPLGVYYELMNVAEESALYQPRWYYAYKLFEEEVEALAAFEEALADSDTVFHAEPLLAAALLAFTCNLTMPGAWLKEGYYPSPGQHVVIVSRQDKRYKIIVARSLYTLALAAFSAFGAPVKREFIAALPDPAAVRREVFEEKPPYAEASEIMMLIARRHSEPICGKLRGREAIEMACPLRNSLIIRYKLMGPSMLSVEYLEC